MRIFITGGTGFIGSNLVKDLEEKNYELLILTRNNKLAEKNNLTTKYICGTLDNLSMWQPQIELFNPEIIIHLAWEGIPDYGTYYSLKNLNYSLNLISLVNKLNVKTFISLGSCWEYKDPIGAIDENYELDFNKIFSQAKNLIRLGGEELIDQGCDFYWLRLFYAYGEKQKDTSLIPYIFNCINNNLQPTINNPNGKNDFIYIKDVIAAIQKIIEIKPAPGTYNLGSGKLNSVRKIMNLIKKKNIIDDANFDNNSYFWADINKLKTNTGWEPKYTIEDGISILMNNYQEAVR